MVQKQAAYSRDTAGKAFAEDDPLAELARLVGYDAPTARRADPPMEPPPASQVLDLQEELLQGLGDYGAAPAIEAANRPAVPSEHAAPSGYSGLGDLSAPRAEPQGRAPGVRAAEIHQPGPPAAPAVSVAPVAGAAPEPALNQSYRTNVDTGDADLLADELEWSVGALDTAPVGNPIEVVTSTSTQIPVDPSTRAAAFAATPMAAGRAHGGAADPAEGYGRHRLPLANFSVVRPAPVSQPVSAPRVEPLMDAPSAEQPDRHWSGTQPSYDPAPPTQQASKEADAVSMTLASTSALGNAPDFEGDATGSAVSHQSAASGNERRFAEEDPDLSSVRPDTPLFTLAPDTAPQMAFAAAPLAPPSGQSLDFLADLMRQAEDIPVATEERSVGHAPVEPAPAPASTSAPVGALPTAAVATTAAVDDADLDADLFGGDFDLDLDDIELDLSDLDLSPTSDTPAPVAATVLPVASAPVSAAAASSLPHALDHAHGPAHLSEVKEPLAPLPFDAAEIADQDEQLEAVAPVNVPDLPPVEDSKPQPMPSEFDFDIDAELATLLEQSADTGKRAAPVAAAAVSAAAAAASQAARPVAAAPMPPIADQVRKMPSDDFDVFEKALEEDFRRSLDGPHSFGARPSGPVSTPVDVLEYEEQSLDQGGGRRGWVGLAAAASIVLLAGGGAFAWLKSGGEGLGSGEPRVVMADKAPVKVVPENPGGTSVPNQNKAVYDRVSGSASDQPKQKNLISSDEQPVDVSQRTLEPDGLPLENESGADNMAAGDGNGDPNAPVNTAAAGQGTASGGASSDPASLGARKVKTMIVRPDGSLVAQETTVAPATPTGQTNAVQANQTPSPALSQPSQPAQAAPVAAPQTIEQAMATPDPITEPDPATTAGVPAPNMPIPTLRPAPPAAAAKPASTAVAKPSATGAPPATTASVPAAAVPPATPAVASGSGDYVIQISSLPTEADARKTYQNLSSKFASVIGGRGVDIRAADIPGKGTFYRVRIPAGSRADANALCERYKQAGGTCMVTR